MGSYLGNEKDGSWQYWDDKGNLKRQESWLDRQLIDNKDF
jgi:hypothetical protein